MPYRFLCPRCHGKRTTICKFCGGGGKRLMAGIAVGKYKECATGLVDIVVTFAAVPGKLTHATPRRPSCRGRPVIVARMARSITKSRMSVQASMQLTVL